LHEYRLHAAFPAGSTINGLNMSSLGILAFRICGQEKSEDGAQHSMHVSMFNSLSVDLPLTADVFIHGGDSRTSYIAACVMCAVHVIDCWVAPFPNSMNPTESASKPEPGARYCIHTLGRKVCHLVRR
jgi:hypothetical protein